MCGPRNKDDVIDGMYDGKKAGGRTLGCAGMELEGPCGLYGRSSEFISSVSHWGRLSRRVT